MELSIQKDQRATLESHAKAPSHRSLLAPPSERAHGRKRHGRKTLSKPMMRGSTLASKGGSTNIPSHENREIQFPCATNPQRSLDAQLLSAASKAYQREGRGNFVCRSVRSPKAPWGGPPLHARPPAACTLHAVPLRVRVRVRVSKRPAAPARRSSPAH